MKTLYHPNMRDTSIEVEDDKVDSYTAQGWRKTPRPAKKETAPKPAPATNTNGPASGEDTDKEV